jgi:calcineurin-like phosphoesterase family protein
MKIWIISDTHFNHSKLVEYEQRPANFTEIIIRNWNKDVAQDDMVVHLGDVILGHDSSLDTILSRLQGRKILVRGNHDHKPNAWYIAKGFDFVCDSFIYKKMGFSHAPLTPLPNQLFENHDKQIELNIHGHFHRGEHRGEHPDKYFDIEYYKAHKEKYHLIQIEDTLRPYLLDHILKEHNL